MHIYKMTPEQLDKAMKETTRIATEIGRKHPDAAHLMLDAVQLAMKEMLVHVCKGDREVADKIFQKLPRREH